VAYPPVGLIKIPTVLLLNFVLTDSGIESTEVEEDFVMFIGSFTLCCQRFAPSRLK
jgi:hypothetical protein